MFVTRSLRSVFAVTCGVLATVALAGCYDLSAPDGPRREDFMTSDPSASAAPGAEQGQQAQQQALAERSEQAAKAATKAVTTADPGSAAPAAVRDLTLVPMPSGSEMSVADYVARYIQPAAPTGQ